MKYYAGIGSRSTPQDIKTLMTLLAGMLGKKEYILRSGGAEGADTAFEAGAIVAEIYLPWNNFNGRQVDGKRYFVPAVTYDFIEAYHPAPERLSIAAQKLMSRNTYQILGQDLQTPCDFVVCWTSDGKASGGTGQALRIASSLHIPIYNLYNKKEREKIIEIANDV